MTPPDWHWYERFGIEPPFPWLGIAIAAVPISLIVFAVIVGLWWPR